MKERLLTTQAFQCSYLTQSTNCLILHHNYSPF
uniref:Uncharacterized protein n=1 Tax=Anguilla anguilla TaxID=7936 RepID=A0A0E9SVK2_ANGAN